jgi:hypothetical protein
MKWSIEQYSDDFEDGRKGQTGFAIISSHPRSGCCMQKGDEGALHFEDDNGWDDDYIELSQFSWNERIDGRMQ